MNLFVEMVGEPPVVKMGSYELKWDTDNAEEYMEKARRELRETDDIVKEALEDLLELIKEEPDLRVPQREDVLVTFLRPCKFYPVSAFKKIKNFYSFRVRCPKYCDKLVPSAVKVPFDLDLLTVLPLRDQDGKRILIIQAGKKWNTKKCSVVDIFRGVMLLLELALLEPKTQISGVSAIFDLNGLGMQHVWQITPRIAADLAHWVQECIPLRVKGLHIVNQPYVFNMIFAIFKPLLTQKLRNRIHFHGSNWESLHEHIESKYLPVNFGGDMEIPENTGDKFYEQLISYEQEFVARSKYGYQKKENASA